jgi:hypothetical protein
VCKDIIFHFGAEEIAAMGIIMDLITCSLALSPLNYAAHNWPIILAVNSSITAVRYVLMQVRDDKHQYLSRFGSIVWTEHESQYSQAKLKLYSDNTNTTQTLEYTKDKYNVKIRKQRVSPKVPPTTFKGRRIK